VDQHIHALWQAVDTIVSTRDSSGAHTQVLGLAQCSFGCRTLIALLDTFGKTDKMTGMISQLVGTPTALLDLITHEYANYTIQGIVEIQPDPIIQCVLNNFLHCALSNYGNYVIHPSHAASFYWP
jgi:hypothetical protein